MRVYSRESKYNETSTKKARDPAVPGQCEQHSQVARDLFT